MSKVSLVACAVARMAMKVALFSAGIFIMIVVLLISGMLWFSFFPGFGKALKHRDKILVGMVLTTVACWIVAATTWIPFVVKGDSVTGAVTCSDWLFAVVRTGIMISMANFMALFCILGIVTGASSAVVAFGDSMDDCRARTRNLS